MDYLSNHRGVAFEFTGAAEATEKVARRRSNKGWKPLVNDQKVAQRYQHALNGAFVGQSCRSIDQLGERVVEIAEQHAAAKKYEKSEEIEAIDVKLDELRKLRKALCMEQRKQTAKAIAKLMKKKAKIVAKRKMQKLIKERSGVRRFTAMRSNSNNIAQVMDSEGNLCEDPTDIANAFAEYYTKLYEHSPEDSLPHAERFPRDLGDTLDISAISIHEVKQQAMKLPNGKAADETNLVIEMVKHAAEEVHQQIADLLTDILRGETPFPPAWKINRIWVLFKHGDREILKNYRPITLLPILYKLYARIVLDRIKGDVDEYFTPDSAGYRTGYSCEDHIFTASEVIRQAENFGFPLWMAKLDVSKAFDRVDREALWRTLVEAGVNNTNDSEHLPKKEHGIRRRVGHGHGHGHGQGTQPPKTTQTSF